MDNLKILVNLCWLQLKELFRPAPAMDSAIIASMVFGFTLTIFASLLIDPAKLPELLYTFLFFFSIYLMSLILRIISLIILRLRQHTWRIKNLSIAIPFTDFANKDIDSLYEQINELEELEKNNIVSLSTTQLSRSDIVSKTYQLWIHFPSKDDYLIYLLSKR